MDDRAVEQLTREMELTRNEMAALTDALRAIAHSLEKTAKVEMELVELIARGQERKGFWKRLGG